MTSRSQIWDGLQWIDLTGGTDLAFLDARYDALYLRLDGANTPMTGLLVMERTGVGFINMIRTDAAVTDGRGQTNLRLSISQGFVIRTGSQDNSTVPLQDRFLLDFELATFKVPLSMDGNNIEGGADNSTWVLNAGFSGANFEFQTGGTVRVRFGSVFTQILGAGNSFSIEDPGTTGDAANANFAFNGITGLELLRISTSARKYKSNIAADPTLADLILEPVRFHHDGNDKDYIGFIADDMPDEAAIMRTEGEVENYDLRAVVAILAAKVNRMEGA